MEWIHNINIILKKSSQTAAALQNHFVKNNFLHMNNMKTNSNYV